MNKNCEDKDGNCKVDKSFYVGVCIPWGQDKLMWDVSEDKDYLSCDLLSNDGDIKLPLLKLEAKNEEDAVKEYKEQVPAVKYWNLEKGWL